MTQYAATLPTGREAEGQQSSPAAPPAAHDNPPDTRPVEFKLSPALWITVAIMLLVLVPIFRNAVTFIVSNWQMEEYSHGVLIPVICALMLFQRRRSLQQTPFQGSWAGVLLVLAGIALYFVGAIASIAMVDAYAMVLVIAGLFLAVLGWGAFRIVLPVLALLVLMNPIPAFIFNNLSSALQLISSRIGVAVIHMFGISAYLEGNVIDLGNYQLQVVEACSGLRYLFPLLTLGVIVASVARLPLWMRLLIVISTIPITIVMNSFRIGVIGILVDRYGIEQAEGFLHDFEGWAIFMVCFALLLLEVGLLMRLRGDRRPLREVFAVDWPAPRKKGTLLQQRRLSLPAVAAAALVAVAAVGAVALPSRAEIVPGRNDFTRFPLQVGEWQGHRDRIEGKFLDALQLDDYILADYANGRDAAVNFYVAYYASQRAGRAAHSPASCLPGGGWRMSELAPHVIPGAGAGSRGLQVNRVIIAQGEQRQLVYYWFKQRDRTISSELMVKWYLLWDSLTRNRSDGALVRLVTPLGKAEPVALADARLTAFAHQAIPQLSRYVPD